MDFEKISLLLFACQVFQQKEPRIFVASDVYTIINHLQLLRPHWRFVQLPRSLPNIDQLSHGHIQGIFNQLSLNQKLFATRILMTEIEILSRARYVVCTFSSN